MIEENLQIEDLIPVFDEDDLGYETRPVFPRVVRSKWRYQDISNYEYEFQYMFRGELITSHIRSRKELEKHLISLKERFGESGLK